MTDPSNADPRFERARIRQTPHEDIAADARPRQARDAEAAAFLARHVALYPQGFAVVTTDSAPAAALAALLRVVGGAEYAPARDAVAALAAALRPATLGGVLVAPAGRLGAGWLLAREPAACAAPVAAHAGAVWDGRFRLSADGLPGVTLGALGADTPAYRQACGLPALVLRSMPCLRRENAVIACPAPVDFTPPAPAAGLGFLA